MSNVFAFDESAVRAFMPSGVFARGYRGEQLKYRKFVYLRRSLYGHPAITRFPNFLGYTGPNNFDPAIRYAVYEQEANQLFGPPQAKFPHIMRQIIDNDGRVQNFGTNFVHSEPRSVAYSINDSPTQRRQRSNVGSGFGSYAYELIERVSQPLTVTRESVIDVINACVLEPYQTDEEIEALEISTGTHQNCKFITLLESSPREVRFTTERNSLGPQNPFRPSIGIPAMSVAACVNSFDFSGIGFHVVKYRQAITAQKFLIPIRGQGCLTKTAFRLRVNNDFNADFYQYRECVDILPSTRMEAIPDSTNYVFQVLSVSLPGTTDGLNLETMGLVGNDSGYADTAAGAPPCCRF